MYSIERSDSENELNCKRKNFYLTEHPEVGGQHEVGGDAVQQPAPDQVFRPDRGVEQDSVVPRTEGWNSTQLYLEQRGGTGHIEAGKRRMEQGTFVPRTERWNRTQLYLKKRDGT